MFENIKECYQCMLIKFIMRRYKINYNKEFLEVTFR